MNSKMSEEAARAYGDGTFYFLTPISSDEVATFFPEALNVPGATWYVAKDATGVCTGVFGSEYAAFQEAAASQVILQRLN